MLVLHNELKGLRWTDLRAGTIPPQVVTFNHYTLHLDDVFSSQREICAGLSAIRDRILVDSIENVLMDQDTIARVVFGVTDLTDYPAGVVDCASVCEDINSFVIHAFILPLATFANRFQRPIFFT